jgi:hypothetical protein
MRACILRRPSGVVQRVKRRRAVFVGWHALLRRGKAAYSGQDRVTPTGIEGWHGLEPVDDRDGCPWRSDAGFGGFWRDGDVVTGRDLRDLFLIGLGMVVRERAANNRA